MAKWNDAMPELDVSPQGIIGRLHRLAARLTEELVAVYSEFGLGEVTPSGASTSARSMTSGGHASSSISAVTHSCSRSGARADSGSG
jgi:hypothetical protein